MKHNKHNQTTKSFGIRRKLILYLGLFTIILFLTLYLTQTVFLDDFYRHMKLKEPKTAAAIIASKLGTDALPDVVTQQRESNQLCIQVLNSAFLGVCTDSDVCYSHAANGHCFLHDLHPVGQRTFLTKLKNESSGTYFGEYRISSPWDNLPKTEDVDNGSVWLYVTTAADSQGAEYYIIISTTITPVSAAVKTLRSELLVAMIVFIAAAVVMGIILSRSISKPLETINAAAEKLGRGEYDLEDNLHSGQNSYREIVQLKDTLMLTAQELKKTDTLRRELIANISHDLRTPLTMIRGYAEMMRDIPGENTPQNMQIIVDESARLSSLVNDLLDLSKLQSGTAPYCPAPFSITACIRQIIERCSRMTQTDGYHIDFICDCGEVMVYADPTRIEQVIYNLLGNAINYTGADKRILVRESFCANHTRVHIDVIDTGSGIAPENLTHIWDRYYKENKTHKRSAVGTGLGLSIVKQILEQHNAHYGVLSDESPQHHGSCFWFELNIYSDTQIPAP